MQISPRTTSYLALGQMAARFRLVVCPLEKPRHLLMCFCPPKKCCHHLLARTMCWLYKQAQFQQLSSYPIVELWKEGKSWIVLPAAFSSHSVCSCASDYVHIPFVFSIYSSDFSLRIKGHPINLPIPKKSIGPIKGIFRIKSIWPKIFVGEFTGNLM